MSDTEPEYNSETEMEETPELYPNTVTLCLPFRNDHASVLGALKISARNLFIDLPCTVDTLSFLVKYYIMRSDPFTDYIFDQVYTGQNDYSTEIIPVDLWNVQLASALDIHIFHFLTSELKDERAKLMREPLVKFDVTDNYNEKVIILAVVSTQDPLEITALNRMTAHNIQSPENNKKRFSVNDYMITFLHSMDACPIYNAYVYEKLDNNQLDFLELSYNFGYPCVEEEREAKSILLAFYL